MILSEAEGPSRWLVTAVVGFTILGCAGQKQQGTAITFDESSAAYVVGVINDDFLQREDVPVAAALLEEPVAVAFDARGNLIIADRGSGRILKSTDDGYLLAQVNYAPTRGLSRTQAPRFVSVDLAGNVFVSDAADPWVSVYDADLRPMSELEPPYNALNLASGAISGLAQGAYGEFYMVDKYSGSVYRFDASGRFMQDFYEEGSSWTRLTRPHGADCSDIDGSVYVCETGRSQIVVFNNQGQQLNVFGGSELKAPVAIALDQHGRCFVADSAEQEIVVFTDDGKYIARITGPDMGLGDFGSPTDVAIRDSTLHIAEPSSGRILQVRFRNRDTSP